MIDLLLARQQAAILQTTLDILKATLSTEIIKVSPGLSLQAALDRADTGSVLELEPGTYEGPFFFRRPVLVRPTVDVPAGRTGPTFAPVTLTSKVDTVSALGTGMTLSGLQILSSNPSNALLRISGGEHTTLDRCLLRGGETLGQHRGIEANGAHISVNGCHIDRIRLPSQESQAICGWNGTNDIWIANSYLAGCIPVMFGGVDSTSEANMPRDILVENSELTKDEAWFASPNVLKGAFELKCALNTTVRGCSFKYAGVSQGQGGYLIVLTPRNQNGKAPWSTVRNVLIENCTGSRAGGVLNMQDIDNNQPSGPLVNVTLRKSTFTELDRLDPGLYPGLEKPAGRIIQFLRGPSNVTVEDCAFDGKNLNEAVYFVGAAPKGMVLRNLRFPVTKYGIAISGGAVGLAGAKAYASDGVFENLTGVA